MKQNRISRGWEDTVQTIADIKNEIYYLTYHWPTNIQKHAKHRFSSILIDNEQEYANLT